ncbi:MAG: hypothetical protein R3C18_23200 [Planctomycetaceae bacterium]
MTLLTTLKPALATSAILMAMTVSLQAQQPSEEYLEQRYNNLLDTADAALGNAEALSLGFDEEIAAFKAAISTDDLLARLKAKQAMLKYVTELQNQLNTAQVFYTKAMHALRDWDSNYGPLVSPTELAATYEELRETIEACGNAKADASRVRLEILADYF